MKVLFVCKSNQFRSQMAAALYNKLTGTSDASSAGTCVGSEDEPEGSVIETYFRTSDFFELMEREGMHVRGNRTTRLTPEMLDAADVVVNMAEEPFIPEFLKNDDERIVHWNVANPAYATRDISNGTIRQVKELVKELIRRNSL